MAQSPWILVVDRHLSLCVLGRVHTQGGCNRRVRTCQSQSAAEVPISGLHLNPLHDMSLRHQSSMVLPLEEGSLHDTLAESHAATPRRRDRLGQVFKLIMYSTCGVVMTVNIIVVI